jgi:hypothetical protein
MNFEYTSPQANVPVQRDDEPAGDRAHADKTWMPPSGEQGISNRPDDELAADDDGEDVAATSEDEDPDDVEKADDDENEDDDDGDDDEDEDEDEDEDDEDEDAE